MSYANKVVQELEKRINDFDTEPIVQEFGTVIEVGDGIVRIDGLQDCKSQEVLEFESGVQGLALNLEEDSVRAIILGETQKVQEGMKVVGTGQIMSVPVGESMIGRVVNSLGEPIDGEGEIKTDEMYPTERIAPGVIQRKPVSEPLYTGIKSIDALIPIGKGQRELIIGDRQTGKSAIAIDTIINQKGKDVICIYVAIGQKDSRVARTVSKLKSVGAMDYTVVFNAGASEPSSMLYLAPYSGVALAEYFAERGRDVLIVYDDLSKHAVAYREMSLLLRRPPGREAYPGDVFYLHSRLLERACRLHPDFGGGSITALPIIETQAGDLSTYIPTNVISITDGQIFLESSLFYKGVRPAVSVGSSVSRVGSSAQIKPMKKVAGGMKLDLAQFSELEAFAQFSSDLDPETKKKIERGARVIELLKQPQFEPMNVEEQVVSIFAASKGYFDEVELPKIKTAERGLLKYMRDKKTSILDSIAEGSWDDDISEKLTRAVKEFFSEYDGQGS